MKKSILALCAAASSYALPIMACSPPADSLSSTELPYLIHALQTPGLAEAVKATGKQDPNSLRSKVIKTITYTNFVSYTLTTNEGCTLQLSGAFKPAEHAGQCPQFEGFKISAGTCPASATQD